MSAMRATCSASALAVAAFMVKLGMRAAPDLMARRRHGRGNQIASNTQSGQARRRGDDAHIGLLARTSVDEQQLIAADAFNVRARKIGSI